MQIGSSHEERYYSDMSESESDNSSSSPSDSNADESFTDSSDTDDSEFEEYINTPGGKAMLKKEEERIQQLLKYRSELRVNDKTYAAKQVDKRNSRVTVKREDFIHKDHKTYNGGVNDMIAALAIYQTEEDLASKESAMLLDAYIDEDENMNEIDELADMSSDSDIAEVETPDIPDWVDWESLPRTTDQIVLQSVRSGATALQSLVGYGSEAVHRGASLVVNNSSVRNTAQSVIDTISSYSYSFAEFSVSYVSETLFPAIVAGSVRFVKYVYNGADYATKEILSRIEEEKNNSVRLTKTSTPTSVSDDVES